MKILHWRSAQRRNGEIRRRKQSQTWTPEVRRIESKINDYWEISAVSLSHGGEWKNYLFSFRFIVVGCLSKTTLSAWAPARQHRLEAVDEKKQFNREIKDERNVGKSNNKDECRQHVNVRATFLAHFRCFFDGLSIVGELNHVGSRALKKQHSRWTRERRSAFLFVNHPGTFFNRHSLLFESIPYHHIRAQHPMLLIILLRSSSFHIIHSRRDSHSMLTFRI